MTSERLALTLDETLAAQTRRSSIARMGAYAMHAKHDGRAVAAKTMDARLRRYELQLDPTGELKARDPQALAKRVQAQLKLEMERVRYARSQRAADRRALTEMLRRTPSDDFAQLAAITAALALNEEDATPTDHTKTEAASIGVETAPRPRPQRKQAKAFTSDGSPSSVASTRGRRQTSTPTSAQKATPTVASPKEQKKAAKNTHAEPTKPLRAHKR